MPQLSTGSSELEGVEEDGVVLEVGVVEVVVEVVGVEVVVDVGVEEAGKDEASPHATRNNAAKVVIDSKCFLFINFSFSYE